MKKVYFSLVLISSLYGDSMLQYSKTINQGVLKAKVDPTSLVRPEDTQEQDGFLVFGNYSLVDNTYANDTIQTNSRPRYMGEIGLIILPETLNLQLSYGGFVSNEGEKYSDELSNSSWFNQNAILNEPKKPLRWIDVYLKPFSTDVGEFGFGYTNIESSIEVFNYTGSTLNVYNLPNATQMGVLRYNDKTDRYTLTYNIPPKDNWYDGLGVSYGYEKSNRVTTIDPTHVAIKPDITSHILSVGIMKTYDEVKNGLSFKKLTCGVVYNDAQYHDYQNNIDRSFKSTNMIKFDAELIYMFKTSTGKKFYTFIRGQERANDKSGNRYFENSLGLGFLF